MKQFKAINYVSAVHEKSFQAKVLPFRRAYYLCFFFSRFTSITHFGVKQEERTLSGFNVFITKLIIVISKPQPYYENGKQQCKITRYYYSIFFLNPKKST